MTDPTPAAPWPTPAPTGPVDAVVRVPGSKSWTNRWLVLAALADGPCVLRQPLVSRDTLAMVEALRALGHRVDTGPGQGPDHAWRVEPGAGVTGAVAIDCGQAGTVMRFVPPLAAALAEGPVTFDGHATARLRPVGPVLEALRQLGVEVEDDGRGTLPYTVHGRATDGIPGGRVEIDASASSQFVSALLLAGGSFSGGLELVSTGAGLPSGAHIQMTLDALEAVGVTVRRPDDRSWVVEPGPARAFDVAVEPDLSSAAPFLALAAVAGGRVTVPSWPTTTTQPGDRMREILGRMGAETELTPEGLVARGTGRLQGLGTEPGLDLSDEGELTPVVTALAALASGPSRLSGIAHLRGHETDRLAALVTELGKLDCRAEETADGLVVDPGPLRPTEPLSSYHDHRMAMFAAVLGAAVPGVELDDVATADKTYPGFDRAWAEAVASGGPTADGVEEVVGGFGRVVGGEAESAAAPVTSATDEERGA